MKADRPGTPATVAPSSSLLGRFAKLLQETIGLDAKSIGATTLARAVREQQAACGMPELAAYWEHVRRSDSALQELIDAVTVPETWFFRERGALDAMTQVVRQEWLPQHPEACLRLLSLPCSSGEEPFSMAMALLDAGVPATRFQIDAVDISTSVLATARRAVYSRNAFRGTDLHFRARHFTPTVHGYQLSPGVRRQVHFRQGNIFAADSLLELNRYDIIFCRNVLIYFTSAMQERAIEILLGALDETGWLFVGAAETPLLRGHGLVPIGAPMTFGFRRDAALATEAPALLPTKPRPPPAVHSISNATPAPAGKTFTVSKPRAAKAMPSLQEAARLADLGQLEQAAALCEQYLQRCSPQPQALYLLGLVQDARGYREQAADYYRKTLYLDPYHDEALAHLACLLEQMGDTVGVMQVRRRLERLPLHDGKSGGDK